MSRREKKLPRGFRWALLVVSIGLDAISAIGSVIVV